MAEYINREALRDEILNDPTFDNDTINYYLDVVDLQPSADVVEVVHGEWVAVEYNDGSVFKECSNCGARKQQRYYNFCPNCGAKMRGDKK